MINSGHLKSRHNKPHTKDEKTEKLERDRPELKVAGKSHDLPAVQCKDTLLLDYDHSAQYTKRKIESNFDRYKELPNVDDDDDDDENGQLSAADFQQLLSRPATTGDHFTFSAERSWLQSADTETTDDSSMVSNLFKLNITNLNDGLIRLPFYLRHDLPTDLFTEEELTDIHYRSKFFESEQTQQNKPLPTSEQVNQNLLDCLKSNVSQQVAGKKLNAKVEGRMESSKNVDVKSFADTELVKLLQQTKVQDPSKNVAAANTFQMPTSAAKASTPSKAVQVKPASSSSSKANVPKAENIQDWLDDILNE